MIPKCKETQYVDITSQCTFVNCTHDGGTIFVDKKNKIVYLDLMMSFSVTSVWGNVLEIPAEYVAKPIIESQQSTNITATNFWIQPSGEKNVVKGELTNGKQITIQGYYFLKDFMDA